MTINHLDADYLSAVEAYPLADRPNAYKWFHLAKSRYEFNYTYQTTDLSYAWFPIVVTGGNQLHQHLENGHDIKDAMPENVWPSSVLKNDNCLRNALMALPEADMQRVLGQTINMLDFLSITSVDGDKVNELYLGRVLPPTFGMD